MDSTHAVPSRDCRSSASQVAHVPAFKPPVVIRPELYKPFRGRLKEIGIYERTGAEPPVHLLKPSLDVLLVEERTNLAEAIFHSDPEASIRCMARIVGELFVGYLPFLLLEAVACVERISDLNRPEAFHERFMIRLLPLADFLR